MSDPTDEELIGRFLEAIRGLSLREAAEASRLSFANIRRYKEGKWERLHPATRRKIIAFLDRQAGARRAEEIEPEGEDLFVNFDRVVRYLGGVAPPGQDQAVKRDILEGIRRAITATRPLPRWWYEIKEMVDRGEL